MSRNRIVVIAVVVVVAAAGLLAGGVLIGQRMLGPLGEAANRIEEQAGGGSQSPDSQPDQTDEPAVDPDDFVEFADEEAGFQLLLPPDWDVRSVEDPQIRLLATPNDRDSVMVRVSPLNLDEIEELDIDDVDDLSEEDLAALHGFTEEVVRSSDDVEVLMGPRIVQIADTASTYYLYTFGDGDQRGAHAHYFMFHDGAMITLVLQAVPEERFVELADVFDVIAESFSFEE